MTPLHSLLKRLIEIDGRDYVLTLSPEHLRLTAKGKRNGLELAWRELVNGEAALAVALRASVGAIDLDEPRPAAPVRSKGPRAAASPSTGRGRKPSKTRPARRTSGRGAR